MGWAIARDAEDLDRAIADLTEAKLPLTVWWKAGADRSEEQNALQWLWAGEVATQRGDVTPNDVQAEWKLCHGVPILRADNPEFRAHYDRIIRPMAYEDKVRLMLMGWSITSIMKVRQMIRYLDAVQAACADEGFRLTDPNPGLAKYHASQRRAA